MIVDVALKFNSTGREINVISVLQDAANAGDLGDFIMTAITGTRHDTETTSAPTTHTSPSDSK